MKLPQSQVTLLTLAVSAETARLVMQKVMGNDIADTIAGSRVTQQVLYSNHMTQAQNAVNKQLGST